MFAQRIKDRAVGVCAFRRRQELLGQHDRANPQLGKSRFNVLALETLPRAEKDLAIARLGDPGGTRMPPWRAGSLTPESIAAATVELQK